MKPVSKINKKLFSLLFLLIFATITVNAQITIRETSVIEKAALKPQRLDSLLRPERFDSLSNMIVQKRPIDYKKYIGYKLFFPPKSKNYSPKDVAEKEPIIDFLYTNETNTLQKKTNIYLPHLYRKSNEGRNGKIGTLSDSIEGRYFTIIDIKGKESYYNLDKEYVNLAELSADENNYLNLSLKITLRSESNKDTLNYIVVSANFTFPNGFFLVPYFEKQRSLYLNKRLVLKLDSLNSPSITNLKLKNFVDLNTGTTLDIKRDEIWTCSDISFADSEDSPYMKCFYFFKNGNREFKLQVQKNDIVDIIFISEKEFKEQELYNLKKAEEIKREAEERKKQEILQKRLDRAKFVKDCIAKWGQKMGNNVANGNVVLGMNKEMCTTAWGEPLDINKTIARGFTTEQWVYGLGTYLYFSQGVLTTIQN